MVVAPAGFGPFDAGPAWTGLRRGGAPSRCPTGATRHRTLLQGPSTPLVPLPQPQAPRERSGTMTTSNPSSNNPSGSSQKSGFGQSSNQGGNQGNRQDPNQGQGARQTQGSPS